MQIDSSLLLCLQTSIDALDKLPFVKECFFDLGSFPEDEQIADTVLMDMWVELYKLNENSMDATEYLLELSLKNLVTLVQIRYSEFKKKGPCIISNVSSQYRFNQP